MDIIIFKTNVTNAIAVKKVARLFTTLPGIQQWNFDLEDCDKILRVVSSQVYPDAIASLLNTVGVECEELAY